MRALGQSPTKEQVADLLLEVVPHYSSGTLDFQE